MIIGHPEVTKRAYEQDHDKIEEMSSGQKMSIQHLAKLREQLAAVQEQIRTLQGKEAAFKQAISIVSDLTEPTETAHPNPVMQRRTLVKDIVLRIAQEYAADGVVAAQIVKIAKAQGVALERNSVSSLLSKFKRDGVLDYDGKVYRPKQRL